MICKTGMKILICILKKIVEKQNLVEREKKIGRLKRSYENVEVQYMV